MDIKRSARILAAAGLAAALTASAPAGAGHTPAHSMNSCVAHDFAPECGIEARGPVRYVGLHAGPWVVAVYRDGAVIQQAGNQGPNQGVLNTLPGDRVQARILQPGCDLPEPVGHVDRCGGFGPVALFDAPEAL